MGYKIVVNEYSNLPGLNSTKVLVSEYAAIGTKTSKVIVVEGTNIGTAAYNEAKAAAVTATNAANQATATLANAVVKSNPISDVVQGTAANSLARRDWVLAQGQGNITTSISLPAGAPATGYIPVIFEGIGSNAEVYISTYQGGGSLPMNNCSFNGIVRASGWGDGFSYSYGYFTAYDMSERSIHSIHGPSESVNAAVFYVETRAFPITVKAAAGVTVRASATNLVYGTSTFAVNGQDGVGNIKTMTFANLASGTGIYKGSSVIQNQEELDTRYLQKSGGTVNGQLVVSQSGNASIVINSTTGNDNQLQFQNNGKLRWLLGKDAVVETGGNVGGDLNLFGYQDDGTFGGSVLKVRRSTRQLEFQTQPLSIAAQSTSQYALTRRDWVEGELAKQVSKTGDTMTGSLIAAKIKNSVTVNDKGSISLQDSGGSRFHLYSDGNTFKVAHGNNGELDILSIGSNGTASLTGGLTLSKGGNGLTLNPAVGSSSYILGQVGGVNNWYVGKGDANGDSIQLSSYAYGTSISLQSDRVVSNKPLYVGTNRAYDEGFKPTTNDVQAASFRNNFASQLGINRSITGATVPTHAGVWAVNNSTWTPVGYGSLYVTTNRVDELTTTGTGSFIHYLFISHNNAQLFTGTNVNGTWSGWRAVIDDRRIVGTVSQSAGVPTGAIIERGTFTNGEYVKYADGTMLQMGSLAITGKAVSSAAGSIFQSAEVDTITFGIPFVGLVRPSVDFMYTSGGSRPWSIITGLSGTSMGYVLQSGTSMTALSGTYYWSAMGRWF